MKTNWLKTVSDINKTRYSIPEGWDTKEQVAASLQCAPDKVADLLKPGLQAGLIDKQSFSVWDESRRMAVPVTCYRVKATAKDPQEAPKDTREAIIMEIKANPKKRDYDLARRYAVDRQFVADIRAGL